MKRIIRIIVFAALGIVFLWTMYFLYKKSDKPAEVFETAKLDYRDIIRKTVATGSVSPKNETDITPQVSGIVEKIFVEAGNKVQKGDPIAQIRIIADVQSLNNAENQVKKAEINLKDKKTVYDRQKQLFDQEVISAAEFEQYKYACEQAQQDLRSAQNNLNIVKKGISLDASESTNTIVRSTINGMVLDVPIEEGYSVIETNPFNPGTTIASIADMKDMEFKGSVDETEVGKIKTGMNLLLNIGALDNVVFDAVLRYIAPKGKEENGAIVFDIEADVKLIDSLFVRAGYSANADIVLERKDSVLSIEEKNLIFSNDSVFAEIEIDSLVFEKRPISIGISDGIYAEVIAGLEASDKVKVQK